MIVEPGEIAAVLAAEGAESAGDFWARLAAKRLRARFSTVSESFPGLLWVAVEASLLAGWRLTEDPGLPRRIYNYAQMSWYAGCADFVAPERSPAASKRGLGSARGRARNHAWQDDPSASSQVRARS